MKHAAGSRHLRLVKRPSTGIKQFPRHNPIYAKKTALECRGNISELKFSLARPPRARAAIQTARHRGTKTKVENSLSQDSGARRVPVALPPRFQCASSRATRYRLRNVNTANFTRSRRPIHVSHLRPSPSPFSARPPPPGKRTTLVASPSLPSRVPFR